MPNCPGCERRVPYDNLRRHVNECLDVPPGDDAARVTIESLDRGPPTAAVTRVGPPTEAGEHRGTPNY